MFRKPKTLAPLILSVLAMAAHAQSTDGPSGAAKTTPPISYAPSGIPSGITSSAAKTASKTQVELLCEGKLRVFNLLPDGSEREAGTERSHDINLRVIDKKAFRSYDDEGSALQIRFEDPKPCLARSDGSACLRQIENPDGRKMIIMDHLDINRFNGRLVLNHLRTFAEPLKRGEDAIAGVRLEYAGQCSRADAPRPSDKPIAAPAKLAPTAVGKGTSIWATPGATPDTKTPAAAGATPGVKP